MSRPKNMQHAANLEAASLRPLSGEVQAGQFVVGKDHIIVAWDKGMERLTNLKAERVVGTKITEPPFNSQTWLVSYYLKNNWAEARAAYGQAKLFRLPMAGDWVGVRNYSTVWDQKLEITELVTCQNSNETLIQTVFATDPVALAGPSDTGELASMRILAEHVPAGVALMQDGKLIFVNQTFCTMFGYTNPAELIDKPSAHLLVEEDRTRHTKVIKNLSKQEDSKLNFQWTGVGRQGRKFWFEGRPVPIEWQGRPAVLSFVMDITEFKQREELMEKESRQLKVENIRLKTSIDYRVRLGNIIGRSAKMQEVFESIIRAASSDFSIVIYGETGTGKELVSKAIHELSQRNEAPFVPVNCGAIPEELFESEFFGHKKGSFTGAHADKTGFLDQAKGGTIFLDEIGELTQTSQVKLLRALGSGEYTAIGSAQPTKAQFRVIAATNADLEHMAQTGRFRQDLFFRIHVIPVYLPPLRERKEDIPHLAEHILNKLGYSTKISSKDLAILLEYDWPGNVRELYNILERYMAFGNLDFLQVGIKETGVLVPPFVDDELGQTTKGLRDTMMALEKKILISALEQNGWNRSRTAKALDLPRKTLFRKMQKLGITQKTSL
ncbi:sigma-54 interaction domain-containing protein [Dethiosulfatarculus sandiegensis]|uniref:sigma-54 interaction domain-containing protein n=1 Tax=Dethiosulfatarculus sandiegensis TaxID=1429043 RepID=UPI000697B541|nr:sigma 54-interacting transcriptional regulator [Dethiosulfatarculus sandiegensis]